MANFITEIFLISFTFNIGKVPMTKIKNGDIQRFVDYVSNKI